MPYRRDGTPHQARSYRRFLPIALLFLLPSLLCFADAFEQKRQAMVDVLRFYGIKDERVLSTMGRVPRHLFVNPGYLGQAYVNTALPIDQGQTISQPLVVAHMSEVLRLEGHEKVLEVGTGSGYQAAVLSCLAKDVYTIEIVKPLYEKSKDLLARLGYRNVRVRLGDGYHGWPEVAPFDAIMVTAAAPKVPAPLLEQLKEGGRLVMPVGDNPFSQKLVLIEKRQGRLETSVLAPVAFVPMTGEVEKR